MPLFLTLWESAGLPRPSASLAAKDCFSSHKAGFGFYWSNFGDLGRLRYVCGIPSVTIGDCCISLVVTTFFPLSTFIACGLILPTTGSLSCRCRFQISILDNRCRRSALSRECKAIVAAHSSSLRSISAHAGDHVPGFLSSTTFSHVSFSIRLLGSTYCFWNLLKSINNVLV